MAPSRRKGVSKAAAAAAARCQWKVGDLVLAKVKGFPAWPATVSAPEKWGYSQDWKKVLVYFFGTKQIAFCNPADVEEFTEEKKVSLLGKRQGRGADFVRAVQEIVDCFDKLNEKSRLDKISSDDSVTENGAAGELSLMDTSVPDATKDSTLRSSDSRKKCAASLVVKDDGVLTEVESMQQGGASEEPAVRAVAPSFAVPNTCSLRKKSRSFQPQRCANQKKGSVQRSRSSSKFVLHGLQDDVTNCNGGKNSADNGMNGFWDGPLRKAKRSKRSPDGSAFNIGHSPICNSNGAVDDNKSDGATTDSENLSDIEGNVIESEQCQKPEIVNGGCVGSLELCKRFDFQANTGIVRKKRNPGRKRVHHDGLESDSRIDCVNKEVRVGEDQTLLPSSHKNMVDRQLKDEGDKHLPLVKRARVRLGKLLSEEQQLDATVKSEDKLLGLASSTLDRNAVSACASLQHSNPSGAGCLIGSSPTDNCSQVPIIKTYHQIYLCSVNEPMECSPSDNVENSPDKKRLSLKPNTCQPFGSSIVGESALPPSKRLHRALEAMSANVAEEWQILAKENPSTRTDKEVPSIQERCSNMAGEDKQCNSLKSHGDCDGHIGVSEIHCPSTCDAITRTDDVIVSDSSEKDLACAKMMPLGVHSVDVAFRINNKDPPGFESTGLLDNDCKGQSTQTMLTCLVVPESTLASLTTVLSEPLLKEFDSPRNSNVDNGITKNFKSKSGLSSERPVSGVKAVDVTCHADTTADACGLEATFAAKDNLCTSASEQMQTRLSVHVEEFKCAAEDVNVEALSSSMSDVFSHRSNDGASISGCLSQDQIESSCSLAEVVVLSRNCSPKGSAYLHENNSSWRPQENHALGFADSEGLVAGVRNHVKSGERINMAEVKASLASLELTLGSLTRTKESIGRATRIAVDCVKFGVSAEVVELLVQYLEKELSLYRRVDLFFLVDSICQSSRGLKGDAGGSYISAVKESLALMLSAAAPAGHAAKDNRRQCLKVLRLWLDRRFLPESIIRQHMREIESRNCPSGHSRRMLRTERSFDDPLRDMEGMLVDEYGSNSSFQLPGFCMPRMLKEEGSDSDGGSFEAVTPEHDSRNSETRESTALPAAEKHSHILEDVDGELEMEDVAPSCNAEVDPETNPSAVDTVVNTHQSREQFSSFFPPLPHDVPPGAPPLPSSPPPLLPLPPPPPPPHATAVPCMDVDPHLGVSRNSMQEAIPSRPLAPGGCYSLQRPASSFNMTPPYPPPSNQFPYHPTDQQYCLQRDVPPPSYYNRSRIGPNNDGLFYGDQDIVRPLRPDMTEGWAYSRQPFPGSMHSENHNAYQASCLGPSCDTMRPKNHTSWGYPPNSGHHQNQIPSRPPCDGGIPVSVRAPGYWQPR